MSVFAGHKLRKKDSPDLVDAETVVNNAQVVALYFSAHWCPPCRGFTPVLKDFYEKVADDLLIIFVSSDRDKGSMDSYFADSHGDYYAVPFDDKELAQALKKECQVQGIPCLCIVDKNGKMVHQSARADVMNPVNGDPKQTVQKWKELVG